MTQDPFASAGTPATATANGDPFGAPAKSSYPKPANLEGCLLLMVPRKSAEVTAYDKKGTTTRLEVDTTILDGNPTGSAQVGQTLLNMYWSSKGIVPQLVPSLPGNGGPAMVLGRLRMPSNKDSEIQRSSEDNARLTLEGLKPGCVYRLDAPTEEDKVKAREFLARKAMPQAA